MLIRSIYTTDRAAMLQMARLRTEIIYKGASIRFTADSSDETLHTQREWCNIVKKFNEMNASPRVLFLASIFYNSDFTKNRSQARIGPPVNSSKPLLKTYCQLFPGN